MPGVGYDFGQEKYTQHIVIDFEMNPVLKERLPSGSTHLNNEIIEIGAVKIDWHFKAADEFSMTVRQEYNDVVDEYIKRLTGINSQETASALLLGDAVEALSEWIGFDEKSRIYSWSDSDLRQLRNECIFKGIKFPQNMMEWMDFQAVYPKVMGISDLQKQQLSLHEAVERYGLDFDTSRAHRALYDAQKTAELLITVLDGSYKKQVRLIRQLLEERNASMGTLGDMFGDILIQAKQQ